MQPQTEKQAWETDQTLASLYFWNDHALFAGFTPDNEMHKHHGVEIFIGINAPINLISEGRVFSHRTMILNANVPHHVAGFNNPKIVIVYDSETAVARMLVEKYLGNKKIAGLDDQLVPLIQDMVLPVGGKSSCQNAGVLYEKIINSLLDSKALTKNVDQRIQKALNCIRKLELKLISTRLIAETIGLSESRLIHLFKEQVGVPIRRYLMWLRLIEAVKSILDGYSLLDAAHNAGFADYAHMSRTFKKMFGNPPSMIFKNSRFVHVFSCFS